MADNVDGDGDGNCKHSATLLKQTIGNSEQLPQKRCKNRAAKRKQCTYKLILIMVQQAAAALVYIHAHIYAHTSAYVFVLWHVLAPLHFLLQIRCCLPTLLHRCLNLAFCLPFFLVCSMVTGKLLEICKQPSDNRQQTSNNQMLQHQFSLVWLCNSATAMSSSTCNNFTFTNNV